MDRKRSIDDANEMLKLSKLNKNDLISTSQAIYFLPATQPTKSYYLLELNNDLLKNIEDNELISFKGCDEDEVVLCSQTSTYKISSTETSNNLLLIKPAKYFDDIKDINQETVEEINVCKIFQGYLEVNLGKTSVSRLLQLLKNTVYKGPEYEHEVDHNQLYTLEGLKNIIQTSDTELLEIINCMDVIEVQGFIRELDFEYHFRILSLMLKLIDENSWALDTIDYLETLDALKDIVPEDVIRHLFKRYTKKSKMIDGIQLYRYDEEKVCQFFARVILRTAGKFNLDDFLQAWSESVPEGMSPNEEMLYGIAIINRNVIPKVIWAFDETTLPDNINDRLHILFDIKDKWTIPEIAPYIRRLSSAKVDVNALLAKHARSSKIDGVKFYSAKHAK